jgi:hypothetical protein
MHAMLLARARGPATITISIIIIIIIIHASSIHQHHLSGIVAQRPAMVIRYHPASSPQQGAPCRTRRDGQPHARDHARPGLTVNTIWVAPSAELPS